MECQHYNRRVVGSRKPGKVDGVQHYKATPYHCIAIRDCICDDCGLRFKSVEVPKELMDNFPDRAKIEKEVIQSIQEHLGAL